MLYPALDVRLNDYVTLVERKCDCVQSRGFQPLPIDHPPFSESGEPYSSQMEAACFLFHMKNQSPVSRC